jgi:hypothetical protein
MSSVNFSPHILQLLIILLNDRDLFRFCKQYRVMQNNQKIDKITFTITPNANGYVIGCNEIPSLFTDIPSIVEIDRIVRDLLLEYSNDFPDDSQKRGFDKDIPIETIWHATPNSVALE